PNLSIRAPPGSASGRLSASVMVEGWRRKGVSLPILLPNSSKQPFRPLMRQNGRCACAHGGGHRTTLPADPYGSPQLSRGVAGAFSAGPGSDTDVPQRRGPLAQGSLQSLPVCHIGPSTPLCCAAAGQRGGADARFGGAMSYGVVQASL